MRGSHRLFLLIMASCACRLLAMTTFSRWESKTGALWLICRRSLFGSAMVVPSLVASPVLAANPTNAGEAIRRSAAGMPGLGPPDVYYPMVFAGSWQMHRQVVLKGDQTLDLDYTVRFIPSIEDGTVVADRGFNQGNLEAALRGQDAVRSYQWTATNPNDLQLVFVDGTNKEIKVTKRATESTDSTVFSSEFQRVSEDDERGIPSITARRVLTKWKVNKDSSLEGLEIVYNVGGGGDPLALSLNSAQPQQPHVLSKSRLRLEKLSKS